MKQILLALIRAYRLFVSPFLIVASGPGCGCRFTPSCSHYADEAVRRHGAVKGAWLAFRRLSRCHPWCEGGADPVPPRG